jgi:hypothetical protein
MVLCVMTIVMAFPKNVRATCVPAIENVSVSASKSKCGFINSCQSGPPVYYLINTYVQSVSATELSANCANNPPITAQQKYNLTEQEVQTMNPMTCTSSAYWSGTAQFSQKGTLYNYSYSGSLSSSGVWDAGGGAANTAGALLLNSLALSGVPSQSTNICNSSTYGSTASGSFFNPTGGGGSGDCPTSGNMANSSLNGLSEEYTDGMLRANMMAALPAYSTNWAPGSGVAFYNLSADHNSCSGGRMEYRFYVCSDDNMKNTQYEVKWKQVTTYPGPGQTPSREDMSESYTGDGNPQGQYLSVHQVSVPAAPSSITETEATLTVISSSPPGTGH